MITVSDTQPFLVTQAATTRSESIHRVYRHAACYPVTRTSDHDIRSLKYLLPFILCLFLKSTINKVPWLICTFEGTYEGRQEIENEGFE